MSTAKHKDLLNFHIAVSHSQDLNFVAPSVDDCYLADLKGW